MNKKILKKDLLFKGQQIIAEDDLIAETPRSLYKAAGKLHEQERDVAKFWQNGKIRIALLGFENQTEARYAHARYQL